MTDGARVLPLSGPRLPRWTDEARWLGGALATVTILTLCAGLIALLAPDARPVLLQEDGIIEMATALALAVVVVGAAAAWTLRGPRLPLLLAGAIGFAELLDEISFGTRLLGVQPPPLYGGGELDGFHDLLIVAYRLLGNLDPLLGWALTGLVLAASIASLVLAVKAIWNPARGVGSWLAAHALILLHFGFVGLAQAIDIAASSAPLSAAEEMLELNAALMLLFYVARQVRVGRAGRMASRPAAAPAARHDRILSR